jgi:hypothetical protein
MADRVAKFYQDFQFVALFLVVFGSLLVWVACHSNYPELKTLGAGIAGAGIQSITSQVRNVLNNRDGGVINNTTAENPITQGATI